jgi:hypothetical protein
MDNIITLFYMKKSGVIKCYCSGKQTLDYYGPEKEDVVDLINYVYVEYDEFLLKNIKDYKVINGKVEFVKEDTNIKVLEV